MTADKDINGLKYRFAKKASFTLNDLRSYYSINEPGLNDATIRWRVYNLKSEGVITAIGHGIYTMQQKPVWKPNLENAIKSLYKKIDKHYNNLNFEISSTSWLNEFTNLQSFRHFIIIEIEKDFTKSIFEYLKDTGLANIYLQPDKKELTNYLGYANETYIIKSLVTKSPYQFIDSVKVPNLEKLLVDLFCEKNLFNAWQGAELKNIFKKAFTSYAINVTVLLNYSSRRARKYEILEFIVDNLKIKLPLS